MTRWKGSGLANGKSGVFGEGFNCAIHTGPRTGPRWPCAFATSANADADAQAGRAALCGTTNMKVNGFILSFAAATFDAGNVMASSAVLSGLVRAELERGRSKHHVVTVQEDQATIGPATAGVAPQAPRQEFNALD